MTGLIKASEQQILAELRRLGKQPFQAILKDHLVAFDLSVIDTHSLLEYRATMQQISLLELQRECVVARYAKEIFEIDNQLEQLRVKCDTAKTSPSC